jgi:hypothetical protein
VPDRQLDRHECACGRLPPVHGEHRRDQRRRVGGAGNTAHRFRDGARRRKIDGDFVDERTAEGPVVGRQRMHRCAMRGQSSWQHVGRTIYHARMAAKECPMCGEFMRLVTRESIEHVPGLPRPVTHCHTEWVCPECDYFEEKSKTEDLAGAERQQDFLAQRVFHLVEGDGGVALVAQTLDDAGPAFFCNVHALALDLHHVHLQGLDEKRTGIPAVRTRQRH